jgi:hypothetical protein
MRRPGDKGCGDAYACTVNKIAPVDLAVHAQRDVGKFAFVFTAVAQSVLRLGGMTAGVAQKVRFARVTLTGTRAFGSPPAKRLAHRYSMNAVLTIRAFLGYCVE